MYCMKQLELDIRTIEIIKNTSIKMCQDSIEYWQNEPYQEEDIKIIAKNIEMWTERITKIEKLCSILKKGGHFLC